ncbi:hypothetical protein OJAV_G00037420 [Oryzias javanicus]|uniref:Uncharacterized protein n=1 Tax=Oryzias javanicus TaxID=123683 RepID=A0A437DGN3_ORYJA|nr:hypothetical protein OJAV_G00037420 [Oryzias javanicus]
MFSVSPSPSTDSWYSLELVRTQEEDDRPSFVKTSGRLVGTGSGACLHLLTPQQQHGCSDVHPNICLTGNPPSIPGVILGCYH